MFSRRLMSAKTCLFAIFVSILIFSKILQEEGDKHYYGNFRHFSIYETTKRIPASKIGSRQETWYYNSFFSDYAKWQKKTLWQPICFPKMFLIASYLWRQPFLRIYTFPCTLECTNFQIATSARWIKLSENRNKTSCSKRLHRWNMLFIFRLTTYIQFGK